MASATATQRLQREIRAFLKVRRRRSSLCRSVAAGIFVCLGNPRCLRFCWKLVAPGHLSERLFLTAACAGCFLVLHQDPPPHVRARPNAANILEWRKHSAGLPDLWCTGGVLPVHSFPVPRMEPSAPHSDPETAIAAGLEIAADQQLPWLTTGSSPWHS